MTMHVSCEARHGVEDIIMSWPIQEVDTWENLWCCRLHCLRHEVMMIYGCAFCMPNASHSRANALIEVDHPDRNLHNDISRSSMLLCPAKLYSTSSNGHPDDL